MANGRRQKLDFCRSREKHLHPVVQKVDSAFNWINHYPVDSKIGFANAYPLDSNLSAR